MPVWVFGNWWASISDGPLDHLVGLGVRLGRGPSIEDSEGGERKYARLRGTDLRICTNSGGLWHRTNDLVLGLLILLDGPFTGIVPGRVRVSNPASDHGLSILRNWIKDCNEHHDCISPVTTLPTRVLDVTASRAGNLIKLLETQGQSGRYIALSHCWGTSHRLKLTSTTRQSLTHGFSINDLPLTFRDAALISRKLSVYYLWIDSLCIIQDDADDWRRKSSKMADVYANSYLTIAAASSTDDSSGFLHGGRSLWGRPDVLGMWSNVRR